MSVDSKKWPPGPKGLPYLGVALDLRRDSLGTLLRAAREYGDLVSLRVMGLGRILINRPEYIQQLLIMEHAKLHKSKLTKMAVGPLLGQGLLISEGDFWRKQRRLAQPAFHRSRVNAYSPVMVDCAAGRMKEWRDGETRDMAEEMMKLTLEVAVQTLFGTSLAKDAENIGKAMTFLMRRSLQLARSPFKIPVTWPTAANRRYRRDLDYMDSLVYRIIEERKKTGGAGRNDLLTMLMAAMNEDGTQMTPRQLRDETMTLFLAGHETTALALSWTWYLLSENPAAETRLYEELKSVLNGRAPRVSDLEGLPYLKAVISEVLRLYPAAYTIARTSIAPCTIGSYDFPTNTTFVMSQWVMH